MDYSNELYKHKSRDILLPFGGYHNFWTDLPNHDNLFKTYRKRSLSVSKEILQDFAREFDHVGQILPEDFIENLRKIRNLIPSHIPIIFINGAELESPYSPEKAALRRHQIMNKALEEFIHGSLNTHLLNVRKTVRQRGHLLDSIRHYNRECYKILSVELLHLLNKVVDKEIKTGISPGIRISHYTRTALSLLLKLLAYIKNDPGFSWVIMEKILNERTRKNSRELRSF